MTAIKQKYVAPDDKRVLVTYPDNTTRETTVRELKEFMKGEDQIWKDNFFYDLQTRFQAFGRFAKYEIILA